MKHVVSAALAMNIITCDVPHMSQIIKARITFAPHLFMLPKT